MSNLDRPFRQGGRFLLILWVGLTLFFAGHAIVEPEHRYVSLFFVLLGLFGSWLQYAAWRPRRAPTGNPDSRGPT